MHSPFTFLWFLFSPFFPPLISTKILDFLYIWAPTNFNFKLLLTMQNIATILALFYPPSLLSLLLLYGVIGRCSYKQTILTFTISKLQCFTHNEEGGACPRTRPFWGPWPQTVCPDTCTSTRESNDAPCALFHVCLWLIPPCHSLSILPLLIPIFFFSLTQFNKKEIDYWRKSKVVVLWGHKV